MSRSRAPLSPGARHLESATGEPPDTASPPGSDRGGLGAHTQNEVPPGRVPGHPEAAMGRAAGGPGNLRNARGTYLDSTGDDYLRGGGGTPPEHVPSDDEARDSPRGASSAD